MGLKARTSLQHLSKIVRWTLTQQPSTQLRMSPRCVWSTDCVGCARLLADSRYNGAQVLKDKPLPQLVAYTTRITKETKSLDSGMQNLVYDNRAPTPLPTLYKCWTLLTLRNWRPWMAGIKTTTSLYPRQTRSDA